MAVATSAEHALDAEWPANGHPPNGKPPIYHTRPIAPRSGRVPIPRVVVRAGFRTVLAIDISSAMATALIMTLIGHFSWAQPVAAAVSFILYGSGGLYRPRLSLSLLDDLPALVARSLMASALIITITSVFGDKPPVGWQVNAALITLTVVCTLRSAFYHLVREVRRNGRVAHTTLIMGAGGMGRRLAELLIEHPEYGLRPIGFCDTEARAATELSSLPMLGHPRDLAALIREHRITILIEAFPDLPESATVEVLTMCDRLQCEIFMVPRLVELYTSSGADVDRVWGMPLVRLRRPTYRTWSWRLKRLFDIVLSALALVLLSPVLALCAIAVRLEGGPGVLFQQERVGLDGRSFKLLKFRSLRPADEEESQSRWNIATDHRLGPVGRFLRQSSLDELPQLINILRGDMTLVGPRPERPSFVSQFSQQFPRYVTRHRVPAGLTGLAQVHGLRGDTSIEERARFDNAYIENWSLWSDVKILLRTAGVVARRAGR